MGRWFWIGLMFAATAAAVRADPPPAWLPRYDLDIHLDPAGRRAKVVQRVTFTNPLKTPAREIVFNAHARYSIPDADVGKLAKIIEVLRLAPKEVLVFDGPALTIDGVACVDPTKNRSPAKFFFQPESPTSLVVELENPVLPGASLDLELCFTFNIPNKKGRWGQWDGVTMLAQWLPTLAVWDDAGWHPTPFVPWHQPFYNEAGWYQAKIALPADQKLACSATVVHTRDLGNGWVQHETAGAYLRDFSLVASARFCEVSCKAGDVNVRCLHFPQHEHYAKIFVKAACDAIPVYEKWFGPYPYPQFTIVEAIFGWNGNECGGMVMIDDRMFNMPHMAPSYPIYLLQHELCHQWWYNVIGSNGYAETWVDEGFASYLSHRLADLTHGKNNPIIDYPKGLGWLPNIHREDLRNYGYLGARARGDIHPTVQAMEKFEHLPNLLATVYDRGSKVVGLIEERLGAESFLDFLRVVYQKYQFRILHVRDLQKELEEYTGRSWHDFFQHWVHGSGMCDWRVDSVTLDGNPMPLVMRFPKHRKSVTAVIELEQCGGFNEPTTLGIIRECGQGYEIRIPIDPQVPALHLDEFQAKVLCETSIDKTGKGTCKVRVEINLPFEPMQITVDPDRVLLDQKPQNNYWKHEVRWRLTPLYTRLEEVDVANSYDRWNFIAGPWLGTPTFADPWYSQSYMAGLKATVFRTQEINAGAYLAYRTNDRNLIAGADVLWDHIPLPRTQLGLSVEKSIGTLWDEDVNCSRGVIFGRYVLTYGSSLYQPPFEYVELFASVQNRCLPAPLEQKADTDPFTNRTGVGIHYYKNFLTPYWDPEGGVSVDATYQYGFPVLGAEDDFQQVFGKIATVKAFPKWLLEGSEHALGEYLRLTRFAMRAGGGAAAPKRGEFFTLGGGDWFRGFDLRQRQGNLMWVASLEWRLPVAEYLTHDFLDHVVGVRNVYVVPFYDAGNAYVNGHALGDVAHAVGLGMRVDLAWLNIIERTMFRFDVAKTVNVDAPWQFWIGITHPF